MLIGKNYRVPVPILHAALTIQQKNAFRRTKTFNYQYSVFKIGMHRILIWQDIRPAGYPANLKA
jgi:hypothetical protein